MVEQRPVLLRMRSYCGAERTSGAMHITQLAEPSDAICRFSQQLLYCMCRSYDLLSSHCLLAATAETGQCSQKKQHGDANAKNQAQYKI